MTSRRSNDIRSFFAGGKDAIQRAQEREEKEREAKLEAWRRDQDAKEHEKAEKREAKKRDKQEKAAEKEAATPKSASRKKKSDADDDAEDPPTKTTPNKPTGSKQRKRKSEAPLIKTDDSPPQKENNRPSSSGSSAKAAKHSPPQPKRPKTTKNRAALESDDGDDSDEWAPDAMEVDNNSSPAKKGKEEKKKKAENATPKRSSTATKRHAHISDSSSEDFRMDTDEEEAAPLSPVKTPGRPARSSRRSTAAIIQSPTPTPSPKKSNSPKKIHGPSSSSSPAKAAKPSNKAQPVEKPAAKTSPKPDSSPMKAAKASKPPPERPLKVAVKPKPTDRGQLWVDKYRPQSLDALAGLQGDKSSMRKLLQWLMDWPKHCLPKEGIPVKPRYAPFPSSGGDGAGFKAAMLSGPPGIGKTTCAELCCEQLHLAYREMNASEARNKKSIETLDLGAEHIEHFLHKGNNGAELAKAPSKLRGVEHVLIMDEVDGMSGNADRLGMSELLALIKRTNIPIICICNDRQKQNIRTGLANYCFDLRFQRPRVEQIKACLTHIAAAEGVKIAPDALDQLIEASHHDVRQCIHSLQLYSLGLGGGSTLGGKGRKLRVENKDVAVNVFESARALLCAGTNLMAKQEAFFSDYSWMSLFVHENYLNVARKGVDRAEQMRRVRRAADSIAMGDLVEKQVRTNQSWQLLTDQAMLSCALPALHLDGYLTKKLEFPAWMGNNSSAGKRQRLMRELHVHTYGKFGCGNHALVGEILPVLRERMYRPLIDDDGPEGVKQSLPTFVHYSLQREDIDAINELSAWPAKNDAAKNKDVFAKLSTRAKSALTRALNKEAGKVSSGHTGTIAGGGAKGGGKKAGGKAAAAKTADGDEEEGGDEKAEEQAVDAEAPVEELLYS